MLMKKKLNLMLCKWDQKRRPFYFIVFIFIACTFIYYFYYWMNIWTPTNNFIISEVGFEAEHEKWKTGCPSQGGGPQGVIVTVLPGGRLGNQVWEYLSVWTIAKRYNVWPTVPRSILDTLESSAFTSLRIPSVEELVERCNLTRINKKIKYIKSTGNQGQLLKAMEYKNNKDVSVIVLRKYIIEAEKTYPYWQELRSELKFKQELITFSERQLQRIKEQFYGLKIKKTNFSSPGDFNAEYVGVHVRRTDFFGFIKIQGLKSANESFFLRAMKEIRQHLKPRDVIFVVVSDDLAWCRKYFKGPDIIIAGNGDIKSPGRDLALLAACNHTIFAYGTFGLTAALHNADGLTIVHNGTAKKEMSTAMNFARHLRNWKVL